MNNLSVNYDQHSFLQKNLCNDPQSILKHIPEYNNEILNGVVAAVHPRPDVTQFGVGSNTPHDVTGNRRRLYRWQKGL